MKQTIERTVAAVQNAPGSMYTRADVISLLNMIEAPQSSSKLSQDQINELCRLIVAQVKENAENLDTDAIDKDSAEMSMGYSNTVELDSVEFDTDAIAREVVNGIGDVIETFFEELEKENEKEDDNEEDNDN